MAVTSDSLASLYAELSLIEKEVARRSILSDLPELFYPLLIPSRYKGIFGGRGSSKSWKFADLLLKRCLEKPGTRAVCAREIQKSLGQSVKRLLEDRIKFHGLGNKFRITNTYIETPGKGLIIFQGLQTHTAESIKSLEGYDIAWVEESQNLSQRSLDLLRPTIRNEGSELWFSWNPRHATDPVDVLLRSENTPPDAIVIEANYADNPHFPEVLRKEMEWDKSRDFEKYQHVWLGQYEKHSEARVFKNWKIEDFDTPPDTLFYLGGDWGFSVDPTVLVRCFVVGRTLYIDREVFQIGCEIDHIPALFDTLDPMQPGMARKWVIVADSARPETISYLKHHGYPKIEPAIKGKDSVKEGVIFLQGMDIVVHSRCKHTIDELTHYSFKKDPLTEVITPILEDKKNHIIDSLRYAVEKIRTVILEQWVSW